MDCGEADPVVLEFDHRDRATKAGYVTMLAMRKAWRKVLEEIAKCEVRCANCHRERTARQFNWRKIGDLIPDDHRKEPLQLLNPVHVEERLPLTASNDWPNDALGSRVPVSSLPLGGETPTTRRCTKCGALKRITDFAYRDKSRGSRRTNCRSCSSRYSRDYYLRASGQRKLPTHQRNQRKRCFNEVVEYLRNHPCVECGETNPVLLDFDHRDQATKVADVAWLLARGSIGDLRAEVAKCDVRCANCHRRRTARQLGWTKAHIAATTIVVPRE